MMTNQTKNGDGDGEERRLRAREGENESRDQRSLHGRVASTASPSRLTVAIARRRMWKSKQAEELSYYLRYLAEVVSRFVVPGTVHYRKVLSVRFVMGR